MKINNTKLAIGLWSDNYKELAKWYQDVLGLPFRQASELPTDTFIAFDFGENWFWIAPHDKVQGKSKDPYRIMIEFYVENIKETYEELKSHNVEFIAEPFPDPLGGDGWCMTFKDPDGNLLQMYGKK